MACQAVVHFLTCLSIVQTYIENASKVSLVSYISNAPQI
jgi:hypothetical protein